MVSLRSVVFLSAFVALAAGCAAPPAADEATGATADELRGGRLPLRGRRLIRHPQQAYFADVDANGTGCPAGTWDVEISPDGETFTLRFAAYEAKVDVGQALDVKDCQLDIKLNAPDGMSYSVANFFYQGYVFLEKEGMSARQNAAYFFQGDREIDENGNEMTGPKDESYLFNDEVGNTERGAWSSCRRDDALHVKTRLLMKNDEAASGQGFVNSATVDGSLAFRFKLLFRRCAFINPRPGPGPGGGHPIRPGFPRPFRP